MTPTTRRGARAATPRLPAVGTRVRVWVGPRRHAGTVVEHRNGLAWVEIRIVGTEEPRHGLFSAAELERAD